MAISWRARSSKWLFCRRWTSIGTMTFCSTVLHGSRTGDWKTTPTSRLGPSNLWPRTSTSPCERPSTPERILSRVVLPQPLGPTMLTNSRSRTSRLTSFRACSCEASRAVYHFCRSTTRSRRSWAGISGQLALLGLPHQRRVVEVVDLVEKARDADDIVGGIGDLALQDLALDQEVLGPG